MKIGMNMLLWTGHLTEEYFPIMHKLRDAGFDGIEVPLYNADDPYVAKVARELKNLGLASTGVQVSTPEANPISPDPAVRKAAVERITRAARHTAALGANILCGPFQQPLGVFSGNGATPDEKKHMADVMRTCAEEAQKLGVRIAIEFLNRFECYALTTVADALELIKNVNHPNLGMLYDTFHAGIEEKDPVKSLEKAGKNVFHFHVSENDRGCPGKGHVAFLESFKALRKMGYDGWLTIEAFGRSLPDIAAATRVWRDFFTSPDEVYQDGIKFIKQTWAQAAQ